MSTKGPHRSDTRMKITISVPKIANLHAQRNAWKVLVQPSLEFMCFSSPCKAIPLSFFPMVKTGLKSTPLPLSEMKQIPTAMFSYHRFLGQSDCLQIAGNWFIKPKLTDSEEAAGQEKTK